MAISENNSCNTQVTIIIQVIELSKTYNFVLNFTFIFLFQQQ